MEKTFTYYYCTFYMFKMAPGGLFFSETDKSLIFERITILSITCVEVTTLKPYTRVGPISLLT